jgi:histidyl-tRNA synthetase
VGLDRLLSALETLGGNTKRPGTTRVVIANLEESLAPEYQAAAAALRGAGLASEVFSETRKLSQQYSYAEAKGAGHILFRGLEEKDRGVWVLRDLLSRGNTEFPSIEAVAASIPRQG